MEHEDFLERYMKIKKEEVTTLNSLLNAHFNGEYHFENHPAVVATVANMGKAVIAEVMAVKAPVTSDSGILVIPDDDDDAIEIGAGDVAFCDIDGILDCLPEPMKSYAFSWDGGDSPCRHETFEFECDADAMMAARDFMSNHHIDIINVYEIKGVERRHVASYSK
mgnify:FL=1